MSPVCHLEFKVTTFAENLSTSEFIKILVCYNPT